jgi:hypothetical protein
MRFVASASEKIAASRLARVVLALAMVASLVFATVGTVAAGTAGAATQTVQTGTWVGQVERNGNHYDYVGRACPVEVEICVDILARYPIVPQTLQAWEALPRVAGGTARLTGSLVTVGDTSRLLVREVSKA